jgi:hypothetical protein
VNIFGWAADDAGPGWYRLRVPLDELARFGEHTTSVSTTMPDSVLEEADVIVGQRVCQPGSTERWRRLSAGQYGRRPMLVFELDDDLWDLDPSNLPAWNFYRRAPGLLDNLRECAKLADVCTVSTEPLADIVRKINPNVVVLPNQLPASAFVDDPIGHDRIGGFAVGWGGGASHLVDVDEMTAGLRQFLRRNSHAQFVNMGTVFETVARAAGSQLVEYPWTADIIEHYHRLTGLDVGLAPLRPSVFNQSKSEIKFLEYAAAGAVTIASKHGPYERVIEQGVTGLLVSQPHEWASALRLLAGDPTTRRVMAGRAYAYAQTRSIEIHWRSWEHVYLG